MKLSDGDIILLLKDGDKEKALSYLYKQYRPKVVGFVMRYGGNREDAEDLYQEVLLIFYGKVMKGELTIENCNIGGFIVGVAQKRWYSEAKKGATRNKYHQKSYEGFDPLEHGRVDEIVNEEKQNMAQQVLESVGEKCRDILKLVVYDSLSMKEIAEELGYNGEDVVKSIHYRCKKKLKEKFGENENLRRFLKFND